MADKNDSAGRRDGGFDDTNNVRDGQTVEERPHGEVLEASWGGRELIAERVVLHVDANKVVESGGREAEDARDLLSMEKVGCLVPMNPHASEVVAEQIVEGISREERQAVWDPVRLIRVIVEVGFGALPEVADCFGSLLVGSGPHAQANTVQRLGRVLLENKGMVNAVRLAASGADLYIVGETSL